jgi:hypothetical protein
MVSGRRLFVEGGYQPSYDFILMFIHVTVFLRQMSDFDAMNVAYGVERFGAGRLHTR